MHGSSTFGAFCVNLSSKSPTHTIFGVNNAASNLSNANILGIYNANNPPIVRMRKALWAMDFVNL